MVVFYVPQAEARLAAKRAARAEARSIRLKELERQQQEGGNVSDNPRSCCYSTFRLSVVKQNESNHNG